MINDRRLKSGYTDFGPIQIPPYSEAIVLTDRADGSQWLVSFNSDTPERLSISSIYSTIQRKEGVRLYAADDGPKMDQDGEFTIIIRSGHIGLDYTPFSRAIAARDDAPAYARQTADQRELIMDNINPLVLHIGYKT